MSAPDARRPQGEPLGDEELLHWLLDPAARAGTAREWIEARPDAAARLAELEAFVGRVRAVGALDEALPPARLRALTERALAATTREDLSWRGDLRLLRSYLTGRLRTSPFLRVAAASLLVHLAALPLLAFYGLVQMGDRQPILRFELPLPHESYSEPTEAVPAVDPGEPAPFDVEFARVDPALRVENSIALARRSLLSGAPELPAPSADEGRAARLLRARCAQLALGGRGADLAVLAPGADATPIERALHAELLLDRFLVERRAPAGLGAALASLARDGLAWRGAGLVAASALARAESYGLLPAPAADALGQLRRASPSDPDALRLAGRAGEARDVAPLDRSWLEALAAAGDELPPALLEQLLAWSAR